MSILYSATKYKIKKDTTQIINNRLLILICFYFSGHEFNDKKYQ